MSLTYLWVLSSLAAQVVSHPAMRPLPAGSDRPLPAPARFVAPNGNDANAGTEAAPWKTVQAAVDKLQPGETLVLRAGIYHERVTVKARGTADKPITLRSYPGEVAILDGGFPEFLLSPATAWEPFAGGAPDEYVSTKTYPSLERSKDETNLLGNFADGMVPLHGYKWVTDLRSTNEYFADFEGAKTGDSASIYCGPGLWYNPETQRIHVRLAHTTQTCLAAEDNYRGETDPRKVPLVVAGSGPAALTLEGAAYVILQDLAVRGSREPTLSVNRGVNITLEGVTAYGGYAAMKVEGTSGLRASNCAFRGIAAPWTWRGSLKYRAIEARIVSASSWIPKGYPNRDLEFAQCEFTDSVDGVFIGNVNGVKIHHCLLDNVSDDGIFVTCGTAYDQTTTGGKVEISQNLISRTLTAFAFGVGHGRQRTVGEDNAKQMGSGVWIYRNVFDFRRPVHYQQPAKGETEILTFGRNCGDHGSPAWEPMFIYQNTFLDMDPPWRSYYAAGFGKGMGGGTSRRLLNNVFYQIRGLPGEVMPEGEVDFVADGNLHWSAELKETAAETHLKRFRGSPAFQKAKWTALDRYGDPKFAAAPANWKEPVDLRLGAGSAALGIGVPVDAAWPDPLRGGKPDAGAIPDGVKPWRVGVNGRMDVFGNPATEGTLAGLSPFQTQPRPAPTRRAAVVMGYPAWDGPILEFILQKHGYQVDVFDKTWLPAERFADYEVVTLTGDLTRAKMQPDRFAAGEIASVRSFLEEGGVMLTTRETLGQLFRDETGKAALESWAGALPRTAPFEPKILETHPWLEHLDAGKTHAWMNGRNVIPLSLTKGQNLIGDPGGRSLLGVVPAGKGRIVNLGWNVGVSLPEGRKASTEEMEADYEAQYRLLENILAP